MIESNIRFLSRMELIYTCMPKMVIYLTKNAPDKVLEQPEHYADPNDYNRIFYHQRNDDMEAIVQTLLTVSECLLKLCKTDFQEVTECQLLSDGLLFTTRQNRLIQSFVVSHPLLQAYQVTARKLRKLHNNTASLTIPTFKSKIARIKSLRKLPFLFGS